MTMPAILDSVRVKGRDGVYLVVRVDEARELVDVANVARAEMRIVDLPFALVEPLESD